MNDSPDAIPQKIGRERLSLRTKLAYGVGGLGVEIPNNILVFFLLFFLWFVPPTTNQWLLFAYFSGIALLFYKAFTVVGIPYRYPCC